MKNQNPEIKVLIGLSGSGKTTQATKFIMAYINDIIEEFNTIAEINLAFVGVRDSLQILKGRIESREDLRPWYKKLFQASLVNTKYIDKQYSSFINLYKTTIKTNFPKVFIKIDANYKLEPTIICDLDGTLSLFGDRNPYDRDFQNDTFSAPVLLVLKSWLQDNPDKKIHFFSGRDEKFKERTLEFLTKEFSEDEFILEMRHSDDRRGDYDVKQEMYNANINDRYFVHFVIDDRLKVCRLWNRMGLFLFNVNQDLKEF